MSRNKIIAIIVVGVIVVSLIVLVWVGLSQMIAPRYGANIGIITLTGPIEEEEGGLLAPYGITPELVRGLLERVEGDGRLKAVVLRINSPGGTVAASQEIGNMIKEFEKPVVVSMADTVASGGYYISAHADRIVAQPGTLTGSIGVIWTHANLDGLFEKLGIEVETITSGEHKDMFVDPLTPERRQIFQRLLDEAYDQFIQTVAEGRDLELSKVRKLATGELYIGTQALELGLVDQLGGLNEAIEAAAELAEIEVPLTMELAPPAPSLLELFLGQGSILWELAIARVLGEEMALLRTLLNTYPVPRY
ncbi:protease IV [Candidatus Hakubella thermalkaliphila]|uniref:Protease IV n=1 Tax=Candidatus Hakubella thermalkaliphila TaxID=2754717 RepID=A0A6V8PTE7_9ACTN|nr:signal peptide peptidase SppA [Candidatus Hakubella thermalkaliphila]GFP20904.1 protease IV [Candidatus Hakubella thermalkaliphila]GFP28042.1 protease IV [Candidatus Hakubella thermalkaliphila]GFP35678.1 protease IV [Candidatus Hakubella thermalkaliphila]